MGKRLLKSLLKPSAYDEPTSTVRLVQTHVSFLFITDHFVYKIKKPVDLGFLNFTTLDRRRFYCNEEVRLNRRLCPDIYLGVLEVRESSHGVNLRGEGTVIDYAVKMKRLPEERMLDRLLEEDAVSVDDIRRIARVIAAFHLAAERGGEIDKYGSIQSIRKNWDENFLQVSGFIDSTIDRRDLGIIHEWVDRFMSAHEGVFEERVRQGFIRDCDGDIHAENICLADYVCIFDCIEFSSRFRYCDTAADIAFLLMDFDCHGKRGFSRILQHEYLERTGDEGMPGLIRFYKVLRAVIRGKVESLRLRDPHIPDDEKRAAQERARRYFRLARGYCLLDNLAPTLVVMCGLTGSGKSTIAAALGFELGVTVVSSDRVRKELAALPESARVLAAYEEGMYAPEFTAATYRELLHRTEQALAGGETVIADATFRYRSDRLRFRELAARSGASFVIIHVVCPEKLVRQRLHERGKRSDEVSDGRWEIFLHQKEDFEPLTEDEGMRILVDSSRPLNDTVGDIFKKLGLL
jgi:uncharacterized protein